MLGPPNPACQAITEAGLVRQVLRHADLAGIPADLRYPAVLRHYWATQQVAGALAREVIDADWARAAPAVGGGDATWDRNGWVRQ